MPSNLFQLLSCILLLVHGQISVLKYSLVGGILANILLLLGVSIAMGGYRRPMQFYNGDSAHTSSVMLSLASTSILIPTACQLLSQSTSGNIVHQSRGASVVLILVYFLYLYCTLKTHYTYFSEESEKVPEKPSKHSKYLISSGDIKKGMVNPAGMISLPGKTEEGESIVEAVRKMLNEDPDTESIEKEEEPLLAFPVAIVVFLACAVPLYFCTDNIASSIAALTEPSRLSPTFVGLILLPIPNCDVAPITLARKDMMDSAMAGTVVKSIQTALLVFPIIVLLSWWTRFEDVTLALDGFEVVSLFATILLLNFIMGKGKSIWLVPFHASHDSPTV